MLNKISKVVECGVLVVGCIMTVTGISILLDTAMKDIKKKKFENDIEYVSSLINNKEVEVE